MRRPHFFKKVIFTDILEIFKHVWRLIFLAVTYTYKSRIHCLIIVLMQNVNTYRQIILKLSFKCLFLKVC